MMTDRSLYALYDLTDKVLFFNFALIVINITFVDDFTHTLTKQHL